MGSGLPISLRSLIHAQSVEDNRREFKAEWNKYTSSSVVRAVCAFANDLLNLNGGYVIIGVDADETGRPILPPRGIGDADLDRIQKEIRGQCNRIDPHYQPVLFPDVYEGKNLLVVWAPGGDSRPYQAPDRQGGGRSYFVRQGSETVKAEGALRTQLFDQAARIPFDDRRSLSEGMDAISERLVREFLHDVGSDIVQRGDFDAQHVYSNMRIVSPINEHQVPRNFALLFFVEDPDEIFPGARIEVVQFADDAGGNTLEERAIRGPLHHQIRQALSYLASLGDALYEKNTGRADVDRTVTYPHEAIREAVVNAVYHRSYENMEPTKVYLYPDRMEVISYPGPVQGIELHHLESGASVPPVPARNRKIGELLKELRLAEGRGTGLLRIRRRMSESGSPEPRFDFDAGRTYFRATLPAHPRYRVLHALRESALDWAKGDRRGALERLVRLVHDYPESGALTGQVIEYGAALDDLDLAGRAFNRFESTADRTEVAQPYLRYATALLNVGDGREARRTLGLMPSTAGHGDLVEAAILRKRAREYAEAHRLFERVHPYSNDDPRVVQEFAQTKIALARSASPADPAKKALNREAEELLRRAIELTDDPIRKAWCWFDLAGTLAWLGRPRSDVEHAYLQAISLREDEKRFRESYDEWLRQSR